MKFSWKGSNKEFDTAWERDYCMPADGIPETREPEKVVKEGVTWFFTADDYGPLPNWRATCERARAELSRK